MIINYDILLKLTYVFYNLYSILLKIENKYIKGNSLILYNTLCKNYDNIHDLYILHCIFDIKILTYKSKFYIKYITYMNEKLMSEFTVVNNISINNTKIEILRTIIFIDEINIINTLIIFNCGIIIHYNCYINHIYNYMGFRRDIDNIEYTNDNQYIKNITYKI